MEMLIPVAIVLTAIAVSVWCVKRGSSASKQLLEDYGGSFSKQADPSIILRGFTDWKRERPICQQVHTFQINATNITVFNYNYLYGKENERISSNQKRLVITTCLVKSDTINLPEFILEHKDKLWSKGVDIKDLGSDYVDFQGVDEFSDLYYVRSSNPEELENALTPSVQKHLIDLRKDWSINIHGNANGIMFDFSKLLNSKQRRTMIEMTGDILSAFKQS